MKKVVKIFLLVTFSLLLTLNAFANTGTFSLTINDANYTFSGVTGNMYNFGYYYSDRANNIDLELESEDILFYLEMFVPNSTNRLAQGTYNLSNHYLQFTYSYGEFWTDDHGYIEIIGGAITVDVSGSGDNAVYTITFECDTIDEDEKIGTLKGTYRGPLGWEDWEE